MNFLESVRQFLLDHPVTHSLVITAWTALSATIGKWVRGESSQKK